MSACRTDELIPGDVIVLPHDHPWSGLPATVTEQSRPWIPAVPGGTPSLVALAVVAGGEPTTVLVPAYRLWLVVEVAS